MAYVERAPNGALKGVYAARQKGYAEEELRDDHPDVVAFRDRALPQARDIVAELDALAAKVERAAAAEAVLIEKAVVTKSEIDAKVPEVGEITMDAKK